MLKVISFNMLNPRHGLDWDIPQAYNIIDNQKVSNWQARFNNFKNFLQQENPDIVLLQEVPGFAKEAIDKLGYICIGKVKKPDLTNKNTAILLNNCQEYSKVKTVVTNSDRTVIKAIIGNKSFILGSLHLKGYNLETKEEKQILGHTDLESVLQTVEQLSADIKIIGGDYNEHTKPDWPRYNKMVNYGYKTKIDYDVTEINSNESIDVIFAKGSINSIKSYSVDIKASDHYAVVYQFDIP